MFQFNVVFFCLVALDFELETNVLTLLSHFTAVEMKIEFPNKQKHCQHAKPTASEIFDGVNVRPLFGSLFSQTPTTTEKNRTLVIIAPSL